MTSATDTMPVTLDRAQREALRDEIRTIAGDCGDISLWLEERRMDRGSVLSKLELLERLVEVLDLIGWRERPDEQGELEVPVDRELARWARHAAGDLAAAMSESARCDEPPGLSGDEHLDTLGALQLLASRGVMTAPTTPITSGQRDRWGLELDPTGTPIHPDEYERWQQEPAAFVAVERLHDAREVLSEALSDRVNEAGILLGGRVPGPRYTGTGERLERAQREWATALAHADALLRERQEGGE